MVQAPDGGVAAPAGAVEGGGVIASDGMWRRITAAIGGSLPHGDTLDEAVFRRRHQLMCWLLLLHLPAVVAFGIWQDARLRNLLLEALVPLAALVAALVVKRRRWAALSTTAGLAYCSCMLLGLSGGRPEANFHFFVLIGLIALYQDWVPFSWTVGFVVVIHGIGSPIAHLIEGTSALPENRPWSWAFLYGAAVLAACVGVIIFWKNTEAEQRRNVALTRDLVQAAADRRLAVSELLVHLGRRNQTLIDRQLEVIGDLESHERQPATLREVFHLDHLATRMRRNAESLLVLSGGETPRRWADRVPLVSILNAAAAETADYVRVQVNVSDHLDITGRTAADLTHLFAELIENATRSSPPTTVVRIACQSSSFDLSGFIVSIEDHGVGMLDAALHRANQVLTELPDIDPQHASRLGHQVVARLARRHNLGVKLAHTPGGGLTAFVSLPTTVVSVRPVQPMVGSGSNGDTSNEDVRTLASGDLGSQATRVLSETARRVNLPAVTSAIVPGRSHPQSSPTI